MDLAAVLYLPLVKESLSYHFYFDEIESQLVLHWWAETAICSAPGSQLFIVAHSRGVGERAAQLMQNYDAAVHVTKHSSLLRALADVVALTDRRTIAVVPIGACLAPMDLLQRVHAHHQERQNNYTFVDGLPVGSKPTLFDSDLLVALDRLHVPGLPGDPLILLQRLQTLAGATGRQPPIPLRCIPFDGAMSYGCDIGDVPRSVRIERPDDVAILRKIIPRLRATPAVQSEAVGLRLWKRELTAEAVRRRQQLRTSLVSTGYSSPPSERRKVLYVSKASVLSGAESALLNLVSHVDANRFDKYALVSLEGVLADRLRKAGARVVCPEDGFDLDSVDNLLYALSVLRDIKPDIIHMNGLDGSHILCAAELLKIPIVQHVHIDPTEAYGEYFRSAKAIIAVSTFVSQQVRQFNISPDAVVTIHNGLDAGHFRPGVFQKRDARLALGIPLDARVVLMTARFDPQKRHDLLLDAARVVKEAVPSFHLLLNGEVCCEPNQLDLVRKRADTLGIADCVTWVPFAADMRELYDATDILVLCGEREAFPCCIAEAMAMEVPVVVSKSGGNCELIEHGENGFMVKPGDPKALAAGILEALRNDELSRRCARAARAHVESVLSVWEQARHVMELYDRFVKSPSLSDPASGVLLAH